MADRDSTIHEVMNPFASREKQIMTEREIFGLKMKLYFTHPPKVVSKYVSFFLFLQIYFLEHEKKIIGGTLNIVAQIELNLYVYCCICEMVCVNFFLLCLIMIKTIGS